MDTLQTDVSKQGHKPLDWPFGTRDDSDAWRASPPWDRNAAELCYTERMIQISAIARDNLAQLNKGA